MPTPAVIQYPTRSAPATRGRRANVTPGRWATIERSLTPAEGVLVFRIERVINISMMIPPERPPELPGLDGASDNVTDNYFLERVALGVKIGMVRGGAVEAVGGFGYSDGTELPVWAWFTRVENSGYLPLFEDI
jgi:hypothetical protein